MDNTDIEKHHAATFLIYELNAMLDSGDFDHIGVGEVLEHIGKRDTLEWLHKIAHKRFDIGMYRPDGPYHWFGTYWANVLWNLKNAYGDGQRKWGVQKRGLCLLVAWTNEVLQVGKGWQPSENVGQRPPV